MFRFWGAWSFSRPMDKRGITAQFHLLLHSAGLARVCGLLAVFTLAGLAKAGYEVTEYPEDICATESIYLDGTGALSQGITASGVAYTISYSEVQDSYSDRYISFNPQHASLTIRFGQPVAAVGAMINVSGYGSYVDSGAQDQSSLRISESGYRGVVASPGSIQEVSFTTDNGPMSVLRVDIRPLPLAVHDKIDVFENSDKVYDATTLLRNDANSDGATLAQAPIHAAEFQLNQDGTFVYQPEKNFVGIDSFSYRATNGMGASFSDPATVEINVLRVNCPPEATIAGDLQCEEDASLQTVPGWAGDVTPGPEEEAAQTLSWDLTSDNPSLFKVQPTLADDGTLTFQPALYQSGTAHVTLRIHDDGGAENGGIDTSDVSFTITVTPKAHAPMIEPVMDCAVRAGDALILNVRATEVDQDSPVVYSLEEGPSGATIDALSGQILWRADSSMTGEMPEFVVRATSGGAEPLSSTTGFKVEVMGQSRAPQIIGADDLWSDPGKAVITNISTKNNGNIRYFLASEIPGAMLNPKTGAFHWTPSEDQAGQTVSFAVTAVDLDAPNLCAMKTFDVHVGTVIASRKNNSAMLATMNRRLQTSGTAAMEFAHPKKNAQQRKISHRVRK